MNSKYRGILSALLIIFIGSCNAPSDSNPSQANALERNPLLSEDFNFSTLQGTWILNQKDGFVSLEFIDTHLVILTYYLDSMRNTNELQPSYFYYKDFGRIGAWSSHSFWIETPAYKLDLDLIGNTLVEQVETGKGDVYKKVFDEDQIAFHFFDSSSLQGRIVDVFENHSKGYYQFIMQNNEGFYTVYPKITAPLQADLFSRNDSLSKKAFAKYLYLYPAEKDTVLEIEIENRSRSSYFKKVKID